MTPSPSTSAVRVCHAPGCQRATYSRQWCKRHGTQIYRHGRLTPEREKYRHVGCRVPWCLKPHRGRGLCLRHLSQWHRNGGDPKTWLTPTGTVQCRCVGRGCRLRFLRAEGRGSPSKWCSVRCRNWHYKHWPPGAEDGPARPLDCSWCKEPLPKGRSRYCSDECRKRSEARLGTAAWLLTTACEVRAHNINYGPCSRADFSAMFGVQNASVKSSVARKWCRFKRRMLDFKVPMTIGYADGPRGSRIRTITIDADEKEIEACLWAEREARRKG